MNAVELVLFMCGIGLGIGIPITNSTDTAAGNDYPGLDVGK